MQNKRQVVKLSRTANCSISVTEFAFGFRVKRMHGFNVGLVAMRVWPEGGHGETRATRSHSNVTSNRYRGDYTISHVDITDLSISIAAFGCR